MKLQRFAQNPESPEIPGDESLEESLPPVEAGTDPAAAVEAAGEALATVKSMEVQSLAEVLTRLAETHHEMSRLVSEQKTCLEMCLSMRDEIQATLQDIQIEKEALKNPPKPEANSTPTTRKGLRALIP